MKRFNSKFLLFATLVLLLTFSTSIACTNFIVTKGASVDGSVTITYTCDGEFHPSLRLKPAADYEPGDSLEISSWGDKVLGKIHQVEHTYAVTRLINEHQVVIGETTFDGRLELQSKVGIMHYWDLMQLGLQRAKTAREAIEVITSLCDTYGYSSTGESFSIGDPDEAWILEMIGPGKDKIGATWVAMKIPDGMVSGHANKARIGEFPLNKPKVCLYSDNVIDLAIEMGYYDPEKGEKFNFAEAYCPTTPKNRRYGDMRVWSMLRRSAPSMNLSPDYHRAVEDAEPYPLWVKPDEKLSLSDVFSIMRDHYEDTDFDMTKGIDAGPYGNPNRWRPMDWEVDSVKYVWERPISTQQTGFSMVSQSRGWLPDPVGGVLWYGVDDTYTTCYFPMYCCINDVPKSFATGTIKRFDFDSAWWTFNFVANFATIKYVHMIKDIKAVQSAIEGEFIALQPAVEKTALSLYKSDPDLMKSYLTNYTVMQGEMMTEHWRELGKYLVTKYNDGYVQDDNNNAQWQGYSDNWLRKVVESRPDQFKLPEKKSDTYESNLID